ncbi:MULTISPECIES: DUF1573 domain-containing protein [Reichenbachiella]|uniref:Uncharacterized protein n=1 Tax=Reichenbachiella agariperforans TaxID=156994 RepID=A0A1M6SQX0_REIAG|nr:MULTISPECIES: DUF1573 domain-containing protein [Reichenbachiella]MBU2916236.1 DUF1573 domain-containing protein [Reichenbachiella agariperforans]RJE75472.1 hypothetical protein BGP76_18420 [Reichenbachiella sp. MSK19-1]SHK47142.1 Protein of unknown function [Reichenbachiella agariperforans]
MKRSIFILALVLSTMTTWAQEGAEVIPAGPHISFITSSYDFGDITQGDKVNYTFEFTNDGNQPLLLSNVQTTCGCTASSWPREAIAPGESSKIDVTFNSRGKIGHQNKVITITSNASNNPERVKIVTNVLPPAPISEEGDS